MSESTYYTYSTNISVGNDSCIYINAYTSPTVLSKLLINNTFVIATEVLSNPPVHNMTVAVSPIWFYHNKNYCCIPGCISTVCPCISQVYRCKGWRTTVINRCSSGSYSFEEGSSAKTIV